MKHQTLILAFSLYIKTLTGFAAEDQSLSTPFEELDAQYIEMPMDPSMLEDLLDFLPALPEGVPGPSLFTQESQDHLAFNLDDQELRKLTSIICDITVRYYRAYNYIRIRNSHNAYHLPPISPVIQKQMDSVVVSPEPPRETPETIKEYITRLREDWQRAYDNLMFFLTLSSYRYRPNLMNILDNSDSLHLPVPGTFGTIIERAPGRNLIVFSLYPLDHLL